MTRCKSHASHVLGTILMAGFEVTAAGRFHARDKPLRKRNKGAVPPAAGWHENQRYMGPDSAALCRRQLAAVTLGFAVGPEGDQKEWGCQGKQQ